MSDVLEILLLHPFDLTSQLRMYFLFQNNIYTNSFSIIIIFLLHGIVQLHIKLSFLSFYLWLAFHNISSVFCISILRIADKIEKIGFVHFFLRLSITNEKPNQKQTVSFHATLVIKIGPGIAA